MGPMRRRHALPLYAKRALAAFFFWLLLSGFVAVAKTRQNVRVEIEIAAPAGDTLWFNVDGRVESRRWRAANGFARLEFILPGANVRRMTLGIGSRPATVTIRRVNFKGFLRDRHWQGAMLKRLLDQRTQVRHVELVAAGLRIETAGNEPQVGSSVDLRPILQYLEEDKTQFYFLALAAAVLFFILLSIVGFRGLRLLAFPRFYSCGMFVFLVLSLLPTIDGWLHIDRFPFAEKRSPAAKPELTWQTLSDYPAEYERHFRDTFGFRNLLIFCQNWMHYRCFGDSALSDVVAGREGWLFLAGELGGSRPLDYFRNLIPFSPDELERSVVSLQKRQRELQQRGSRYLLLIVPNKDTVYAEFMPGWIRKAFSRSRLDQLAQRLGGEPWFLDLRQALSDAKKENSWPLYDKTDTHWNEFGAYWGYRAAIERLGRLFPEARPRALERFQILMRQSPGGDLAQLLALQGVLGERKIFLVPLQPYRFMVREPPRRPSPWVQVTVTENAGGELPSTVMFRDSFAHEMMDFLSEHFRRIVYVWDMEKRFDFAPIDQEKPELVIEEIIERNI